MTDTLTVDRLPIEAHRDWAKNSAANDSTVRDAQALAPHYEKSTSSRPIYLSARDQLFELPQGAEASALFDPPPITERLPHHIFVNGLITPLFSSLDDETVEWEKDLPTLASLVKRFGLSEMPAAGSDDMKSLCHLQTMLYLQRLGRHIYANMHKRKA